MKLETCPFCGGEAEIIQHDTIGSRDFEMYSVACKNYDCIASDGGVSYPTEHDAAVAWNRRTGK